MIAFLALFLSSQPPQSAASCARYLVHPDDAQRTADAAAVQTAAGHPTTPSAIDAVLASGPWRAVWARPADSEPGVFVFRRSATSAELRYLDVWGGALGPDGPGVVVAWARKSTHMPLPLARCVAERVAREGP